MLIAAPWSLRSHPGLSSATKLIPATLTALVVMLIVVVVTGFVASSLPFREFKLGNSETTIENYSLASWVATGDLSFSFSLSRVKFPPSQSPFRIPSETLLYRHLSPATL